MPIIHDVDDEGIGRGRQNDSSSSRESSPQRTQKRSFTPTSDDGDLVVPPIADDDTPPPPERPMIRQAVAFSWDTSSSITSAPGNINTYQASLPPKPTPYGAYFLPGQEVPVTSQPPPLPKSKNGSGASKSKKVGGSTKKVRHFDDEFSSQTGSFRLKEYDPTASTVPPTTFGTGPYSSLYRASTSDASQTHGSASPALTISSSYGGYTGRGGSVTSASPVPEISAGQRGHYSTPSSNGKFGASASKAKVSGSKTKASVSKVKESRSKARKSTSNAKSSSSASNARASGQASPGQRSFHTTHSDYHPTANPDASIPNRASASGAAYYRRDYERDKDFSLTQTMSATRHYSPLPDLSFRESPISNIVALPQPANPSTSIENLARMSASENMDPGLKRVVRQLRMLTILIQDIRSGTTDHQLAEVKVPLRVADDPQDGYWADAKEICEKLQSSPSRIDGPAKVYTLRGKYRQFFLRVSSENVDDCIPANIIVSPERTLDVVVETNPPPGAMPLPPRIPRELLRTPTPDSDNPPSPSQTMATHPDSIQRYTTNEPMDHRKRRHSSSSDEYDHPSMQLQSSPSTPISSHNISLYGSPSRNVSSSYQSTLTNVPPKKKRSYAKGSQDHMSKELREMAVTQHVPQGPTHGYESPASDEGPENLHDLISKVVSFSLQKDSWWKEFYKSKAKPPLVKEMLKQFQFVQRMMNSWVGQRAPFGSCHNAIEKSHILSALGITDEKYGSDCTETLGLLELYGPNGQRTEDTRVVAMINDQRLPGYNAKPIKRLLRLLRDIDENWVKDHPEVAPSPESSSGGTIESVKGKEREIGNSNPQPAPGMDWRG